MSCPAPSGVSKCPPLRVWIINDKSYFYIQLCDDDGAFYRVQEVCDGVPTGSFTDYDLEWAEYTPTGTVQACASGGGDASAANQTAGNATLTAIDGHVDGLESAIGTAADVAASADTGTFSLIAIAKRIVAKLTTIIAGIPITAGEAHIGEVAGSGKGVKVALTVSTSPAYTAGDSIGGKITIANAVRVSGGVSILASLQILDRANQKPTGTILIYDANPAAATLTDNAPVVNSTDDLKVIASIPVAASDYTTINSKAYANLSGLARVVQANGSTSLYASFTTTSTPTFAATTDVQLVFDLVHVN